jgi:hypothetical protein
LSTILPFRWANLLNTEFPSIHHGILAGAEMESSLLLALRKLCVLLNRQTTISVDSPIVTSTKKPKKLNSYEKLNLSTIAFHTRLQTRTKNHHIVVGSL